MDSESDSDLDLKFSKHVCLFTMTIKVNKSRLKEIKDKLQDEHDVDEDCKEEENHRLNFHTWVEYKLGDKNKAKEINKQAVQLTESRNITALMYQAFLYWKDGSIRNFSEAERCLDKVKGLKTGPDSEHKIAESEAELAYSFSRIGGADYVLRAMGLYERIVDTFPNEFTWKYRLGLQYRRSIHGNISTSMPNLQPVKDRIEKAAKYLFNVASHCPEACLRGRAFAQLAVMHNYSKPFLDDSDFKRIFREKNVQQLVDEALENGPNDARTLLECGRTLRITDLEKAIELLVKSLTLKKHAITYHHLGLCYESKAKVIAKEQKNIAEGRGQFHDQNCSNYRSERFENDDRANRFQGDQRRNLHRNTKNRYPQSQRGEYSSKNPNRYRENQRGEYSSNTPNRYRENQRGEYSSNTPNRYPQSQREEYSSNTPQSQREEYSSNTPNRYPQSQREEYSSNTPQSQREEYSSNTPNRYPQSQREEYSSNTPNRYPQSQREEYSSNTPNRYPQSKREEYSSNTPNRYPQSQREEYSSNTPNRYPQSQREEYSSNTPNRYPQSQREEYSSNTPNRYPQSQREEYSSNTPNRYPQSKREEYSSNTPNRYPQSQREEYSSNTPNRYPQSQREEYSSNTPNRYPQSQREEYSSNTPNRYPQSQREEYSSNTPNRYPQNQRGGYSSNTSNRYPQSQKVECSRGSWKGDSKTYIRHTSDSAGSYENANHYLSTPKYNHGHHNSCEEFNQVTLEWNEDPAAFGQGFLATNQTLEFTRGRRPSRNGRQMRSMNPRQQRGRPHRLLRCPRKDPPLKREDDFVTKAIDCFKESIQISFDNNNPAIYNLGLILRACEQCGLCLVELAGMEDDERTEREQEQLLSRSEKYLLQAVSLAATLATKDPELKSHAQDIWNAFRTLEQRYSNNFDSPKIIKKLINLLQTVSQYEKIPAVIEKLRSLSEESLLDPKVLKAALKGYLALQDYESALTFLSVSMTTPEPIETDLELDSLILKTQLCTAETRLRTSISSAKLILKPLFESFLNQKDISKWNFPSPKLDSFDTEDSDSKNDDDSIDVLILWDDKSANKDTLESKASALERCISELFGMEVSHNLEKCSSPGLTYKLMIDEMLRPKLILVLLEKHNPSKQFKYVLDYIPCVQQEKDETQAPVVLLGHVDPKVKVQASLQTYKAVPLEHHFENLNLIPYPDHVGGSEDSHWLQQGNVQDMSGSNWPIGNSDIVTSVMTLFCSMIGRSWPLDIPPVLANH